MKRHLLVGRLGPDDNIDIPASTDEQITILQLVREEKTLEYGIGDALHSLNRLGVYPSEVGLDLLIVAAHVHAADTRISRAQQSQDSWTREIRLVVPVCDTERWNTASGTLTKMLNFLTGDRWTVCFRSRPDNFASIALLPETMLPPVFDSLSLFSGGLDSLIGAIDLLTNGSVPLFISHAGESATSKAQDKLFQNMKTNYRSPFDRLRVWMAFHDGLVSNVGSESTTRGRSFLFVAIGIFAGSGLGSPFVLRVPENGLIALNVPMDLLRLGSNSTRTTHPYYMARWNELMRDLGIIGRVENPYWNKTKGEMVASCQNVTLLQSLVADSLSCSSPSKSRWKGHGVEHCGYCLPCLIRRAALNAAWGVGIDSTVYTVADLLAHSLNTNESVGKQVRSFQLASSRLLANPGLAKFLIHKPGSLADEEQRLDQLADVYLRGLQEVSQLIQGVETTPL